MSGLICHGGFAFELSPPGYRFCFRVTEAEAEVLSLKKKPQDTDFLAEQPVLFSKWQESVFKCVCLSCRRTMEACRFSMPHSILGVFQNKPQMETPPHFFFQEEF